MYLFILPLKTHSGYAPAHSYRIPITYSNIRQQWIPIRMHTGNHIATRMGNARFPRDICIERPVYEWASRCMHVWLHTRMHGTVHTRMAKYLYGTEQI